MPSKADYLEFLTKQREEIKPSVDLALGMLKTAAVHAEHMTQSPEWDQFLSMVQGKLNQAKQYQDEALSYCGGAVGDALSRYQLLYQYQKGRVEALEEMIQLPRQVMDHYQEVKKD